MHGGALQLYLRDVDLWRVVGTEHGRAQAGPAGVGRHRRARIAVGRHGQVLQAQLLRHGYGQGQAAGLERAGRQAAFVLDQQGPRARRETVEGDQRRHHLAQRDGVFAPPHRQELVIAPETAFAPSRQPLLVDRPPQGRQIVAHQQRPAGGRQAMHAVRLILLAGQRAFEVGDEGRPVGTRNRHLGTCPSRHATR